MTTGRPTVLVTGIAGNLGQRLLPLLADYDIVGLDLKVPERAQGLRFERVDLAEEASCRRMVQLVNDTGATAIIHLAFVSDPQRTGILDIDRMWRTNVAGTARVMEAVSEINRHGGRVSKFIFPSSFSAYGPDTSGAVKEDAPLRAHTLPSAIHNKEADEVVRYRADTMGDCSTYLFRPHILTGASVQNYIIGMLRGTPTGTGKRAEKMRSEGERLPILLPMGDAYLEKRFQFLHVDDMARLLAYVLKRRDRSREVTVLNVAGRGDSITVARCAELANAEIKRMPKWACRRALTLRWTRGISAFPPEALPYLTGSSTMDCTRLRHFLGSDYEKIIQHTVEDALADCFRSEVTPASPISSGESSAINS